MNGVLERLDRLEQDLRRLDVELNDLRELVTEDAAPPAEAAGAATASSA